MFAFRMQILSSEKPSHRFGFSLGPAQGATAISGDRGKNNNINTEDARESLSDNNDQREDEIKEGVSRPEQEPKRYGSGLNRSRQKRNRRKEIKQNKNKTKNVKLVGINAAGIMTKLDSFENLIRSENPAIFCLQETKAKKENKIKTESTKRYILYELLVE